MGREARAMRIGFLGLGRMGTAIALNLLRAGHEVAVWNRSPDKADALAAAGAEVAATPRAAAEGREIVFSMLSDDAALHAVLRRADGLLAGLGEGALHVSLSTIGVATADHAVDLHVERGQHYISAPVFGRPDAAAAAQLTIVAAGPAADIDRAQPLLDAIGRRTFRVGTRPSAANLVKLSGNFLILAAIEAMAEAMALAEKSGVAPALLLEVLTDTHFNAPVYRNYGALLLEQRFRPAAFAAPLGLKDMKLAGAAAEAARVPMPFLALLREQLVETLVKEGEDVDWSAIGLTVARNAGLNR
ncbi:NAD(P)-dependent oxidoreductase [Sphingomonas quercus]|uniref:NAD(P)-dependent oxidoreductase n=1 Tax=Sphingomonas quercus TaxID=2842451 RepID=A0ABS6BHS2_9SPHN|nr:NAD(P)-dependent oxidoreductase [Sphingomonas quercus]MBU3077734.1 NAD(P)-dependent oxidoreductase [Sphingomonas quercus]